MFAVLPALALLIVAELAGRAIPVEPGETAEISALYDPTQPALAETAPGTWTFARGGAQFRSQSWQVPAADGHYRVIVAGDSTVYGQLPDAIQAGLRVPDRTVEVLNFGLPGAGSDRVRILGDAALTQDPDLLVIYVGHNEVLESRLNPRSLRPFWQRRLRSLLGETGLGRLLSWLQGPDVLKVEQASGKTRTDGTASWDGLPLSDAEWATIAASYERNLDALLDDAVASGVPTAIVEPASSLVAPGQLPLGADPDGTLGRAIVRGMQLIVEGDPDGALRAMTRLESSAGEHPDWGPPLAVRGNAWIAERKREEGLEALRAARRLDGRPSRATERHYAVIRAVAATHPSVVRVEAEAGLLKDARYLDVRDPLFMDPVHPTALGNVVLAGVIVDGVGAILPAGTTFDRSVTLPELTDAQTRGWRLLPEGWR